MSEPAPQEAPKSKPPAFDELADEAQELRRRNGEPELTEEEATEMAVEETKAVRRERRERFLRSNR